MKRLKKTFIIGMIMVCAVVSMIFIDSSFLFPACFRCAIKKPAKVSAPKRTYCFCEL